MSIQYFQTMTQARIFAARHGLREKALCFVVRAPELLVFEHTDAPQAGVQVPAGGVEPGETPEAAALRELYEESGLRLDAPRHLTSYEWQRQLPQRLTHQVCHAFAFVAPPDVPQKWTLRADGHFFAFRWVPLIHPALDWDMDAALPALHRDLTPAESISPETS